MKTGYTPGAGTRNVGKAALGLFMVVLLSTCTDRLPTTPDGQTPDSDITRVENTVRFKALRSILNPPSQVQFLFALRDLNDQAIFIAPEDLAANTRIFEDQQEIDYQETNFFVSTAENFRMDVVLVLDFTNSMASFRENSLTAIDRMVQGAQSIIRSLGVAHRLAMIEFHDRNIDPQVLTYFTSDTTFLLATLRQFSEKPIDNGSTRVWDAVYQGINLFSDDSNPNDVRLLIFLSDGFDTSSKQTAANAAKLAKQRLVQIHCVGTGQVTNLDSLKYITTATDGVYYPAENLDGVDRQLEEIAKNLSGQYKISYISLQEGRNPRVRVEVKYASAVNAFEQKINLLSVVADDRIGKMTYDDVVIADDRASAFLRLEHTPRNINAFRFQIKSSLLEQVDRIDPANGGLLDGTWQLVGPDADQWFTLKSETSTLPFGAFGLLIEARFSPLTGSGLKVPFTLDNSIYGGGKQFQYPDTLFLGLAIGPPVPADGSTNVLLNTTLKWGVDNSRKLDLQYDIRLDTALVLPPLVATDLKTTSFTLPQPFTPNTTYYWQIIAHAGSNHYTGPVWKFTTAAR